MTLLDVAKLSDREIDALVAEQVMGKKVCKCEHQYRMSTYAFYDAQTGECKTCSLKVGRSFSTDDNAARLVRNRIAELGLMDIFVQCVTITSGANKVVTPSRSVWTVIHATPRQQCEAALRVLEAA